MRAALLAYLLHGGADFRSAGVSTYARNLAESLPIAPNAGSVDVFHGSDAPVLRGATSRSVPFPTSNPFVRVAWEQAGFPLLSLAGRYDVIHGTVNVVPMACRPARVVTIHDLSFVRHPERFRKSRSAYLVPAVRASAAVADRIICVSENTRRDVLDLLGVSPEKVEVIPPGVPATFKPLPRDEASDFLRAKFGNRPYLLHVGTLEPRKNIDVLIDAFARLRARRDLPHLLVLVGARGWMYESLPELVVRRGLQDSVRFVDYVPQSDLPLWYNSAAVLVYPSAYEGFGLPVVEAMACGTPVVTTNGGSLAEVAGGASMVVSPGSVEELEVAVERVLDDAPLRSRLTAAGLERAARYSWPAAAQSTWEVYLAARDANRPVVRRWGR